MLLGDYTVLYGGSFNPPHLGHQMTCLYLLEGLGASSVWVVPSFTHPFGKALAPFEHRFAMCKLLARPFGGHVLVSDVERQLGGNGRTYDTLQHLFARFRDLRFALAVGADTLLETHKWYRWDDIEQMLPIVVIGRAGFDSGGRAELDLPQVASSELRRRLAAGESVTGRVPQSVVEYIESHGLYR